MKEYRFNNEISTMIWRVNRNKKWNKEKNGKFYKLQQFGNLKFVRLHRNSV